MRTHYLKTDVVMWDEIEAGHKTAEFRRDDRGFQVGDHLVLCRGTGAFQDNWPRIERTVTHIVRGPAFGIPEGYAMLSLGKSS